LVEHVRHAPDYHVVVVDECDGDRSLRALYHAPQITSLGVYQTPFQAD
jgi:hypothetical protein